MSFIAVGRNKHRQFRRWPCGAGVPPALSSRDGRTKKHGKEYREPAKKTSSLAIAPTGLWRAIVLVWACPAGDAGRARDCGIHRGSLGRLAAWKSTSRARATSWSRSIRSPSRRRPIGFAATFAARHSAAPTRPTGRFPAWTTIWPSASTWPSCSILGSPRPRSPKRQRAGPRGYRIPPAGLHGGNNGRADGRAPGG